jgi:hypothetical protein
MGLRYTLCVFACCLPLHIVPPQGWCVCALERLRELWNTHISPPHVPWHRGENLGIWKKVLWGGKRNTSVVALGSSEAKSGAYDYNGD